MEKLLNNQMADNDKKVLKNWATKSSVDCKAIDLWLDTALECLKKSWRAKNLATNARMLLCVMISHRPTLMSCMTQMK